MHPNYFEGILQLRNSNKEVVDFIKSETAKKGQKIAKEEKVPNGIDFYFVSRNFLRKIGYALQHSFCGELLFSARLHTRNRQTSKDVHRLYVLFRVSTFRKGDSISYKGEKIKIIAIGKKILAKKEDGKKITLRHCEINQGHL